MSPLGGLLDVGINEEGVGLGVDVLHHDLETVETTGLRDLDLGAESLNEVLVDDTIGGGEEGKNVRDEILLVVIELVVPVVEILGEINLFGSPERGLGLLVHLPDLRCNRFVRLGFVWGIGYIGRDAIWLTSWYLMGKRTKR